MDDRSSQFARHVTTTRTHIVHSFRNVRTGRDRQVLALMPGSPDTPVALDAWVSSIQDFFVSDEYTEKASAHPDVFHRFLAVDTVELTGSARAVIEALREMWGMTTVEAIAQCTRVNSEPASGS